MLTWAFNGTGFFFFSYTFTWFSRIQQINYRAPCWLLNTTISTNPSVVKNTSLIMHPLSPVAIDWNIYKSLQLFDWGTSHISCVRLKSTSVTWAFLNVAAFFNFRNLITFTAVFLGNIFCSGVSPCSSSTALWAIPKDPIIPFAINCIRKEKNDYDPTLPEMFFVRLKNDS